MDDSLDFMQGMRRRVKGTRRVVSDEVCAEYYERRMGEFREEYRLNCLNCREADSL